MALTIEVHLLHPATPDLIALQRSTVRTLHALNGLLLPPFSAGAIRVGGLRDQVLLDLVDAHVSLEPAQRQADHGAPGDVHSIHETRDADLFEEVTLPVGDVDRNGLDRGDGRLDGCRFGCASTPRP